MSPADASTDAVEHWLHLALDTLLPSAAVLVAIYSRLAPGWWLVTDLVSEVDLTDEQNDSGGEVAHEPPHHSASRRTFKSVVYSAVGLIELALRVAILLHVIKQHQSSWAAALGVVIWTFAAVSPVLWPTVQPSYSLFTIYTLVLVDSSITILLRALDGHLISTDNAAFFLHVAGCLVGLILCLNSPMRVEQGSGKATKLALDENVTLGQWLSASWFQPIITRARSGTLEESDIGELAADNKSGLLTRKFMLFRRGKKLLARVVLANAGGLTLLVVTTVLHGALLAVQPILLRRILAAIEEPPAHQTDVYAPTAQLSLMSLVMAPLNVTRRDIRSAYLFAFLAFLLLVLRAHIGVLNQILQRRVVMRARAEVMGSIYAKALLRIDTSGIVEASDEEGGGSADVGKIISLVNVDVNRLHLVPILLTTIFETPVSVAITAVFLYDTLGYSGFVGFIMLIVVMPFTAWITAKMMAQIHAVSNQRDIRTRAVNELLQSIKFIKFSGWETRWHDRVMALRKVELSEQFRFLAFEALAEMIWEIVPIFIACISLTWYTVVAGQPLTVAAAFPAISTLALLTDQLNSLPQHLKLYTMVTAALQRIDAFLEESEVPAWVSFHSHDNHSRHSGSLTFDHRIGAVDATFQWYQNSTSTKSVTPVAVQKPQPWYWQTSKAWFRKSSIEPAESAATEARETAPTFQLKNINVVFPRGKISVIIGPTGSGKTALLCALLGEMQCMSGIVLLPKTGYPSEGSTNLVEGISYCAQQPWLESKTVKQNILFGSHYDEQRYHAVIEACALNVDLRHLNKGDETEIGDKGIVLSGGQKARIALARAVYARTQTVILDDVLSSVDAHVASILVNKCFCGPLMANRTLVLATHHSRSIIPHAAWVIKMDSGSIVVQGVPADLVANNVAVSDSVVSPSVFDRQEESKENPQTGDPVQLVESETKATGSVRWKVYATYFAAASWWIFALFAVSLLLQQAGALAEKIWIKVWVESYGQERGVFKLPSASVNVVPYVIVYFGLELIAVLLVVSTIFPSIWSALRASRVLFHRMLDSVLRSPVRFFDKTPTGRILNRFSKDIDTADNDIQYSMQKVGSGAISFIVAFGTICYGIPPFVAPLVLLILLNLHVARGYITASRDLARLQSTARSPVITLFDEMLRGITTIRAFGQESQHMDVMFHHLDRFHWCLLYNAVCDAWLRYRFDILGSTAFGASAILSLYAGISPGLTAIVLVQATGILSTLQHGMQFYVMMEKAMNGVERIEEYIALPPEPPRHIASLPAAWPLAGEGITFDEVRLRYEVGLDPVLRGVSFHVKAGERVGVVGRTGSGKSTLAMSLFRFVDPDSGRIFVGGRDVTSIGVQDLREHLTLIPQDAVLFSGTVRDNLDPFNEHTDSECIDALRIVQLPVDVADGTSPPVDMTRETTGERSSAAIINLDTKVSDGGANWSAGQRQLLAMARACTSIIVLDESTASVDHETDQKIQNTIREQFKGSILLTIAHRLNTIIDYDRVLVLDHGKIVEFDTPAVLIANKGGVFRGLCEQSGHLTDLERAANQGIPLL
ncbi:P-loop containing nucleoside triphosphate hydrolase protein [Auriculariales sp. MPI-PUGE-AT-0066]|nr:P-loop containing nucleoside triphosphate hydrolase protein [Auriculariales sp. MPI-PUGE-AT-0066]